MLLVSLLTGRNVFHAVGFPQPERRRTLKFNALFAPGD
jgi:hypothetical protein